MIEDELKNIKARFGIPPKIAEFHRVMIELAGNRTLIMFSNALAGIVDEHLSLPQRSTTIDPEYSLRQLRYGLKSTSIMAVLSGSNDEPADEAPVEEHQRGRTG